MDGAGEGALREWEKKALKREGRKSFERWERGECLEPRERERAHSFQWGNRQQIYKKHPQSAPSVAAAVVL
jgi:hypothetical protein